MILPPYAPENCRGRPGEERLKERVTKVLAGILKKIDAVPAR